MGQHIVLSAADSFKLGGYRADPQGKPKGGVVVVQEIFGVNKHIRDVCDRFAAAGYAAVAPAVFDRLTTPGFESGYTPDEVAHARSFLGKLNWEGMMHDIAAAAGELKASGPVAVVGFCLGGSAAYVSACRLPGLAATVGYYGGMVAKFADETPKCPVMLHFGALDQSIPLSDVETVKTKRPDIPVYVYEGAGHAFNRDGNAAYHEASAKLAWSRTLDFLAQHLKSAR